MFVDEVDIQVHAGDGGNGCLAFRREMRVPRGGPSGGDGGLGGSIYLVATLHQNTLVTYRFHQEFKAERGQHGQGSNRTGHNGADLVLEVPALAGANLMDFSRHAEVFEAAYHWCRREIDELIERANPALAALLATKD